MPKQPTKPRLSRQDAARIKRLTREVERAKGTVAKTAKALLRAAEKAAREAAKAAEKYNRQQQAAAKKAFRHAWSVLRKKGLVKADARSVSFSARNKRTVEEFANVLSGREKTFRVKSKADLERLRSQGVTVRNGTAVISKEFNIRKGKVFSVKKKGRRIYSLPSELLAREDIEAAVRKAFEKLKPKYGLAFRFQGYESYQIFEDADMMIRYFFARYELAFEKFTPSIQFFNPDVEFEAYALRRQREYLERQFSRDASKKERARARRVARRMFGPQKALTP